jgi:hypothetical protein
MFGQILKSYVITVSGMSVPQIFTPQNYEEPVEILIENCYLYQHIIDCGAKNLFRMRNVCTSITLRL